MIDSCKRDSTQSNLASFDLFLIMKPTNFFWIHKNKSLFNFVINFVALFGQDRLHDAGIWIFLQKICDSLDDQSLLGFGWDLAGIC